MKVFVEFGRRWPILPQVVDWDISLKITALLAYLEHFVFLTKINMVEIAQFLDEEADWCGSCQMEVVDDRLWHDVQKLVKITRQKRWQLVVVRPDHDGVILVHHFGSQF